MSGTIISTREHFIAFSAHLVRGQWLKVPYRNGLTSQDAQAALDAQYGPGNFSASTHGNTLQVTRISAASVGRNAKRHDPAEGRGPQDEHAVGAAETPISPSDHPGERA